jgi:hypothetical protein
MEQHLQHAGRVITNAGDEKVLDRAKIDIATPIASPIYTTVLQFDLTLYDRIVVGPCYGIATLSDVQWMGEVKIGHQSLFLSKNLM